MKKYYLLIAILLSSLVNAQANNSSKINLIKSNVKTFTYHIEDTDGLFRAYSYYGNYHIDRPWPTIYKFNNCSKEGTITVNKFKKGRKNKTFSLFQIRIVDCSARTSETKKNNASFFKINDAGKPRLYYTNQVEPEIEQMMEHDQELIKRIKNIKRILLAIIIILILIILWKLGENFGWWPFYKW